MQIVHIVGFMLCLRFPPIVVVVVALVDVDVAKSNQILYIYVIMFCIRHVVG